jgi:hypothetical protein
MTGTTLGKSTQRLVEVDKFCCVCIDSGLIFIETYDLCALPAFDREPPSRAIYEYLAHSPADRGKKVSAATSRNARVIHELEINLVNKRSRLK